MVIASPEGIIVEHELHLEFSMTSNEAEYQALIADLVLLKKLGVHDLKAYSDSQLVVGDVKGDSKAWEGNMVKYL